jgi:hypothetical protein
VPDVVVQHFQRDALEGLGDRADLGEEVHAVAVVLDHLLDPADLALDPVQPLGERFLVVTVAADPIAVTAPIRSSSCTRAGSKRTRADSVASLTDASTLSSSLSFRSTRETQPAQVTPSISRVTEEV